VRRRGRPLARPLRRLTLGERGIPACASCNADAPAFAVTRGLLLKRRCTPPDTHRVVDCSRAARRCLSAPVREVACCARRARHADVAAQLLEAGADPLLVDRHEHTCLHYAALFGWANCIAALLEGAVRLGGAAAPVWLKDVRVDAGGAARRALRGHAVAALARRALLHVHRRCGARAAAVPRRAPWSACKERCRCRRACRCMPACAGMAGGLNTAAGPTELQGAGAEHPAWEVSRRGARLADRAPPPRRYVDARAAPGLTPLHLAAMHGRAAAVGALLAAGADLAARVGGGPPPASADSPLRWPPAPADATPVRGAAGSARARAALGVDERACRAGPYQGDGRPVCVRSADRVCWDRS